MNHPNNIDQLAEPQLARQQQQPPPPPPAQQPQQPQQPQRLVEDDVSDMVVVTPETTATVVEEAVALTTSVTRNNNVAETATTTATSDSSAQHQLQQQQSCNSTTTTVVAQAATATTTTTTSAATTSAMSSSLIAVVKTYLHDAQLRYRMLPSRSDNERIVMFGLTGEHSSYRVVVETKQRQERIATFVHCPVKVPQNRLTMVAELLMRINYSLDFGNAEMDFDDGEVRIRASLDVEGGTLVPCMVKNLIHASAGIMDRLFPHLLKVMFGANGLSGSTPTQAFEQFQTGPTTASTQQGTGVGGGATMASGPLSSSNNQNSIEYAQ